MPEIASAKIRAKGIVDDEQDYGLPIHAERVPVFTVLGEPEPCSRLMPGVTRPFLLRAIGRGGCWRTP